MSIGNLSNRLQARISQDRETLEQIAHSEFERLRQSLHRSSQNALATIEADFAAKAEAMSETVSSRLERLERQTGRLQKTLVSSWLKSAALGACMMFGIALGGWGLSAMMSNHVQTLLSQTRELQQVKKDLEQTVSLLEHKTWGIRLLATEKGKFILLPPKASIKTGWTFGDNQAIKLE